MDSSFYSNCALAAGIFLQIDGDVSEMVDGESIRNFLLRILQKKAQRMELPLYSKNGAFTA
jgi:hypothetical protein